MSDLSWGLKSEHSLVPKPSQRPSISFRPIQPSDIEILEAIHDDIFPIRYEAEFFQNVVHGRDIVSWAAVDRGRADGNCDELIGFLTARIVLAKESEILDLLKYDTSRPDQTLLYILTLGVVENYRNLGIATLLIREVTRYASTIPTCRGVYLHVISYNIPAIHLYEKMHFSCVRSLHGFYLINCQQYDAYLFVYYVNGGHYPCSLLELLTVFFSYMRKGFKPFREKLWNSEKKLSKWPRNKETRALVSTPAGSVKLHIAEISPYDWV